MKAKAVIFDIDGTIANTQHRSPFDWELLIHDIPHQDIVDLLKDFNTAGFYILLVSGRPRHTRKDTSYWLRKYAIPWDKIFLRERGDPRASSTIKEKIYTEKIEPFYYVKYVFEDRDADVKKWRSLGLRTLQVAPGKF